MEINDERIQEWIDKCPEHDNELIHSDECLDLRNEIHRTCPESHQHGHLNKNILHAHNSCAEPYGKLLRAQSIDQKLNHLCVLIETSREYRLCAEARRKELDHTNPVCEPVKRERDRSRHEYEYGYKNEDGN